MTYITDEKTNKALVKLGKPHKKYTRKPHDKDICECGHKRADHHFCDAGSLCDGYGECQCCNDCVSYKFKLRFMEGKK